MEFRKSTKSDITKIMDIVKQAQAYFKEQNIDQWQNNYPNEEVINNDIENGESYVMLENGNIIATTVISFTKETSYENEINTIVPENSKAAYALIAKGNSMEPVIMNGENIEVISQCELENGEIGIIKLNGEITCKCFYIEGNQYELRSLNPDIAPIIVSKESQPELQIVGKVALTNNQQKRYNAL